MSAMHEHELDVSVELAARLLRSAGLPADDVRRVPGHGTVNAMFRAGGAVVRMPFVPDGAEGIRAEAEWLPRLDGALPVRVPKLLHVGEPVGGYPSPWLVLEWIDGAPATGGTDAPRLADELAEVVLALRALPVVDAQPSHRAGRLADHDRLVRWGLAAPEGLLSPAVTERWEAALAAPPAEAGVMAHTDLLPGNVLVDGDRLVAVIDWASSGASDPATDALAAWSILAGVARDRHLARLGLDDAARLRAEGWALVEAVVALRYYIDSNPGMVEVSRRILAELGLRPRAQGAPPRAH